MYPLNEIVFPNEETLFPNALNLINIKDMTRSYQLSSIKDVLEDELERLKLKNASFSLRSFARLLALSPTHLHNVIQGKKNLSLEQAEEVARRLKMEKDYTRFFMILAEIECSPPKAQVLLKRKAAALRTKFNTKKTFPTEVMNRLSWEHLLCLVSIGLKGGIAEKDMGWLAGFIGKPTSEIPQVLSDLVRANLLQKKGSTYQRTEEELTLESKAHNRVIKRIHSEYLERLEKLIQTREPDRRYSATEFYSIPMSKMDEVRERAEEFLGEIGSHYAKDDADGLIEVCLHLNVSPLTSD